MTLRAFFNKPAVWWSIAVAAGAALLYAAVDNGVYEATTPVTDPYHVVERKLLSIVAFAVVGFAVAMGRLTGGRTATVAFVGMLIAAYSSLIEVLQYYLDPPPEGLWSNAFDIACGFAGGWIAAIAAPRIGTLAARLTDRSRTRI